MNQSTAPSSSPLVRPIPFGLNWDQLTFEELTLEMAPNGYDADQAHADLYLMSPTRAEHNLIMEAALALYEKVAHDTTFDFIDRADVFALCIHTACIWSRG